MKPRVIVLGAVLAGALAALLTSSSDPAPPPEHSHQAHSPGANPEGAAVLACSVSIDTPQDPHVQGVGVPGAPGQTIALHDTFSALGPVPNDILDRLPHLAGVDRWRLNYFCAADVNRDDRVDTEDVALFLEVWETPRGSLPLLLDLNRDGFVDREDADVFFRAIDTNDCDPLQARDHRLEIC